ncbi:caspase-8-like [Rhinoderma darwinii]|uniref:caspase-8-like n=1 Tax=Rhinoderma darwinii TaxID=43563 RepID=UPI003F67496C
MTNFIHQLFNIRNELESSNISELTFLCKDLTTQQSCKGKQDTDLFIILQERGYMDENNTWLIEELLFYLGRNDLLLKYFNLTKNAMVERLKNPVMARISPYRHLLYELGNLVPKSELEKIKLNFTDILPKATVEKLTSLWDLFIELEKKHLIKNDNLNNLEKIAPFFDNEEFQRLILEYKRKSAAVSGSMNIEDSHGNLTCRTEEAEISSLFYKMNSKTRGICVMISNFNFSKARSNPGQQGFKDRTGTKKDEESLCGVLSKLGFQVHIKNDLERNEMLQTINSYRERNHEENDCFICCVLSHGDNGIIYGTDGQSVPISDITFSFSSSQCSTLIGKPKLFFIQACQGKEHQQPVPLQTDACSASASNNFSNSNLIPDEPDFLLGMATTLHYVSYRDTNHGSWYIQSLCKQLHESYQSQEDIISTLTKVNHELSQKQAYMFNGTQMPQPWTTLTKKLVFLNHNN